MLIASSGSMAGPRTPGHLGPARPKAHRVKCTAIVLSFQGVKDVRQLEAITGFSFPRCQVDGEEQGDVLWHRAEAGAETLKHHPGGQIEATWHQGGRQMTLTLPQGSWLAMTTEFA